MILAAAAALVFASCAKTEVTSVNEENNHVIGFTNYAARDITKATVDNYVAKGAKLTVGQKFGVFAYNAGTATTFDPTAHMPAFMNNVAVTFGTDGDTDADANTYSPARYWPKDEANNHLFFYAYYPVVSGGNLTVNVPADAAGYGTYTYVVDNTDITKADDFMLSDLVSNKRVYSETTNGVVPMIFRHQLVKVRFAVKSDKDYVTASNTKITVKKFLLKGVNTKATLAPSGDATVDNWTLSTDAADKKDFDITYVKNELTADYVPAAESVTATENNVYLMLPQSLSGVTLEIEYEVDNGVDEKVLNKKTINMSDILKGDKGAQGTETIGTWFMNNSYVYKFEFSLNEIKFTATAATWEDDIIGYTAI